MFYFSSLLCTGPDTNANKVTEGYPHKKYSPLDVVPYRFMRVYGFLYSQNLLMLRKKNEIRKKKSTQL